MKQVSVTPKRSGKGTGGFDRLYPYYAGYSYEWAVGCIDALNLGSRGVVLDPWNGSGTTTLAAASLGLTGFGHDINPVTTVVAQARMMPGSAWFSERFDEACELILNIQPDAQVSNALGSWFTPETSWLFDRATQTLKTSVAQIDPYASAAATVLAFRVLGKLTNSFEGSNPTWVRTAKDESDLRSFSALDIHRAFLNELDAVRLDVKGDVAPPVIRGRIALSEGDSTILPFPDAFADAVVTSPPYCTRIDYAVATSREMALLGMDDVRSRQIRDLMVGTSTLSKRATAPAVEWGAKCNELLNSVRAHDSKASADYYVRNMTQYFNGLFRSFQEIDRVVKDSGTVVVVVQDSYYKELHIDLAGIACEMYEQLGWRIENREDNPLRRSIVALNTRARAGSRGIESVLYFKK